MAMRRSFRRLLAILYVGFGICVALPLGAYVFAQTEMGRGWIAGQISRLASDGDVRVHVSGLGKNFPFVIAIDRVAAIRNGQRVADINDLKVSWSPWENIIASLEILQGEFDDGFGDGADSRTLVTAQLAAEF